MSSRLLFVDPAPIVRTGISAMLRNSELEVGLATGSVREASEYMERHSPALVVCEIEFADGMAGDLLKMANRRSIPLLLFTACQHPGFLSRLSESGAIGLIPKSSSPESLVAGIRRALTGEKLWSRQDVRRLTGAMATPRLMSQPGFPLTQREFEILQQVAQGQSNRMIAETLSISYETVKEHVQNIIRKLGVVDRTQATLLAVRYGLI